MSSEMQKIELPPMPQVVSKIIQMDENNIDLSSNQIQNIISVDPGLTAKILKLANSAFYARTKKIDNLSQAVTLLGFKTIKSLTLLVSVAGAIGKSGSQSEMQKELWIQAVLTAYISKIIAGKCEYAKQQEEAFLYGLLKNIGRLIIHNRFPNSYQTIYKKSFNGLYIEQLIEAEKETFGFTSAEIAAEGMRNWNFPENLSKVCALTTNEYDKVFEEAGIFAVIAVLAEIIVLLQSISKDENQLEKDVSDKLEAIFKEYAKKLNLNETTITYLRGNLKKHIQQDDFFQFCEEIFTM
ncbi:MAG: HDOD domain-containing protein [Spirochaetia bacterium]|nr:HDOD domain-containing protein [Spirochaetia bacterium]